MNLQNPSQKQEIIIGERVGELIKSLDLDKNIATKQIVAISLGKFAYELASFFLKFRETRELMRRLKNELETLNLVHWILLVLERTRKSSREYFLGKLNEFEISVRALKALSNYFSKFGAWSESLAAPFLNSSYKPATVDLMFLPIYWHPLFETRKGTLVLKASGFAVAKPIRGKRLENLVGFLSAIKVFSRSREIFLNSVKRRSYFNIDTASVFDVGKLERLGTKRKSPIYIETSPSREVVDKLTAVPYIFTKTLKSLLSKDSLDSFPIYPPDLLWGPLALQKEIDSNIFILSSSPLSTFSYSTGAYYSLKEITDKVNEQFYIPLAALVKPKLDPDELKELPKYHLLFFDSVRKNGRLVLKPSARSPKESKNEALAPIPLELVGLNRIIWVVFPIAGKVESLHGRSVLDILRLSTDFYEDVERAIKTELKYAKEGELCLLWLEPVGKSCEKDYDSDCLPRWGIHLSRRPSDFTGSVGVYEKYMKYIENSSSLREKGILRKEEILSYLTRL